MLDLGSAHVYFILITKIEDLRLNFFFEITTILKSFLDFDFLTNSVATSKIMRSKVIGFYVGFTKKISQIQFYK